MKPRKTSIFVVGALVVLLFIAVVWFLAPPTKNNVAPAPSASVGATTRPTDEPASDRTNVTSVAPREALTTEPLDRTPAGRLTKPPDPPLMPAEVGEHANRLEPDPQYAIYKAPDSMIFAHWVYVLDVDYFTESMTGVEMIRGWSCGLDNRSDHQCVTEIHGGTVRISGGTLSLSDERTTAEFLSEVADWGDEFVLAWK